MTEFKKGQIIVARYTKKSSCGLILCHKGEINKVIDPEPDWGNDIKVYRGLKNEKINRKSWVPISPYQEATPEEIIAYSQGKRNISEICNPV